MADTKQLVHFTDVSLKNNTPVNTEVLWGGGLWWGVTSSGSVGNHEFGVH